MNKFLRYLFFILVVRPIIFFVLGINIHNRERLPKKGPAIIVANHNSHLDTMVLMSVFPLYQLTYIKPVAAADYFLRNKILSWFSKNIIGIIPIERNRVSQYDHPLKKVSDAISQNEIVIFFPEGTRGEPEQLAKFKSGIAHLASQHPNVDIFPIFLYGAGKALPKGKALIVPFIIDIQIGEPLKWGGNKNNFVATLEQAFTSFSEKLQINEKDY